MKNFLSIIIVVAVNFGTIFANIAPNTILVKKKKKISDECVISTKNEILKEIINFNEIKNHFGISTKRDNDIKVFENFCFDNSTEM